MKVKLHLFNLTFESKKTFITNIRRR